MLQDTEGVTWLTSQGLSCQEHC